MNKWLNKILRMNEVSIDETKILEADGILEVFLDTRFMNANVLPSEDEFIRIRYYVKGESNLSVEDFFSLLEIEKTKDTLQVTLKEVEYFMMNGKSFITLQLPTRKYNQFVLSTVSGNLQVKEQIIDTLESNASSGDILLEKVEAKRMQMQTKSGNITFEEATSNTLDLKTVSGKIKVNDVIVDGNIEVEAISGTVILHNTKVKQLKCDTSSGEIRLKELATETLEAATTSGNIRSEELLLKNRLKAKSTSGNISLQLKDTVAYDAKTGTLSGRVKTIGKQSIDGVKIIAETLSGNITIQN